jgi:hypothetical protein
VLNKQQGMNSFQKYINDDFGQHTWTTLFTYETNCDYNIRTILLYFKLTELHIQNKSYCPECKKQGYLSMIIIYSLGNDSRLA